MEGSPAAGTLPHTDKQSSGFGLIGYGLLAILMIILLVFMIGSWGIGSSLLRISSGELVATGESGPSGNGSSQGGTGSGGKGTTYGGPHGGTPTVSDDIPEPLRELFNTIGREVGVPPALLAATSVIECGRLWQVPKATLVKWIRENAIVDSRGCFGNNWAGAQGPAQFIGSTWDGIGPRTTQFTGNKSPDSNRIKDAFYGMAILHKQNHDAKFGARQAYTDGVIKETGRQYCNGGYNPSDAATSACAAHIGNQTVGYGAGILHYYHRYQGKL